MLKDLSDSFYVAFTISFIVLCIAVGLTVTHVYQANAEVEKTKHKAVAIESLSGRTTSEIKEILSLMSSK